MNRRDYDDAVEKRRLNQLDGLRRRIHELSAGYSEGYADGPGLIDQLESPEAQTARVNVADGSKRSGKPSARILVRADLLDRAQSIRQEALYWAYRCGWNGTNADRAVERLPDLFAAALGKPDAEVDDDDLDAVIQQFGIFIGSTRTALAYRQGATHYPDSTCPVCEEHSIYAREEEMRGWCANERCAGDKGRRMEWTGIQLRALIQEDIQAREAS